MKDRQRALIQDASALAEADRQVVKAVVEGDFDKLPSLILDFRNKKITVQKGLSEFPVVECVDDAEEEILARVQRPFPTESIIEQLEKKPEEEDSFYELSDEEAWAIGSDLLY